MDQDLVWNWGWGSYLGLEIGNSKSRIGGDRCSWEGRRDRGRGCGSRYCKRGSGRLIVRRDDVEGHRGRTRIQSGHKGGHEEQSRRRTRKSASTLGTPVAPLLPQFSWRTMNV